MKRQQHTENSSIFGNMIDIPSQIHNSQPVKICILSPYAHLSGHHWMNAVQLAEALDSAGCEVQMLTTGRPDPKCALRATIPCRSVLPLLNPVYRWLDQDRKRNQTAAKFLQNIESFAAMAAALPLGLRGWHLHFIDARFFMLLLYVILFPVRVTYLLAGDYPFGGSIHPTDEGRKRPKHRVADFLFRMASRTGRLRFNCETDAVRSNWIEWLPYVAIQTIPVGVQIPKSIASKADARKTLKLPLDRSVFLVFGTHRLDKDYRTIVLAAKKCQNHPRLLFAGPVISANDPKIALEQENFQDATVFNQFVPNDMVDVLFAACDALLLPYPASFDRGSVVLLQSVKYLRPVLATNGALFGSFVPHHKVGLLYECGDSEQLAQRMSELQQMVAADPGRLPFEEGLRKTRSKFSWETVVALYKAHFASTGK